MTTPYLEAFERLARNGLGQGPTELLARRREAISRFVETGFPTSKDEEWRFTPVSPIARVSWELGGEGGGTGPAVTADQLLPFRFGHPDWPTLVFVNGRFAQELSRRSTPAGGGIIVEPLSEALRSDPERVAAGFGRAVSPVATPFTALNAAFAREGAVLRVPAGVEVPEPIHLLFVTTPAAAGAAIQTRCLIEVERGARAQLIESHVGLSGSEGAAWFGNAVCEVSVGDGAWVEHTRIQRETEQAFHIGFTQVEQGRDSHYRSFVLSAGGAIGRHDLRTRLNGENVETLLYGLYFGTGEQLVDNHTVIFHDRPNCRSWEVYKGILDGASHAVFNGKVLVKPEAQKTDAKQTNRNLLLSDRAKVDTKPQLEIFADDVKCTHGATVGRLDELAYFYLQSRGIARAHAQRLLTYAFAAEVVNEVASEPVRDALGRLVRARLDQA